MLETNKFIEEVSRNRKKESTTQEEPTKNYMEWSAAEFQSIVENGPHRVRPCTAKYGYSSTKVAKEEQSITTNASNKGKEDSKQGGRNRK